MTQEQIDEMGERIVEALGAEQALEEVLKALTTDQKHEVFDWIIRCHDLEEVEYEE